MSQGGQMVYFESMTSCGGTMRVVPVHDQQVVAVGGALTSHSQFKLILANAEDDTYYLQCHISEEFFLAVDAQVIVTVVRNQDSASAFKIEKASQRRHSICTLMVTTNDTMYRRATKRGTVVAKLPSLDKLKYPVRSQFAVVKIGSVWGYGTLGDGRFGFIMQKVYSEPESIQARRLREYGGYQLTFPPTEIVCLDHVRVVYIQSVYSDTGYLGLSPLGEVFESSLSLGAGITSNAQFEAIVPPGYPCGKFSLKLKNEDKYLAVKNSAVEFVDNSEDASLFSMERVDDRDGLVTIAVAEKISTIRFIAAQQDGTVYVSNDKDSEDAKFRITVVDTRNLL